MRGGERVRVGSSKQCCDIVIAVKVELNKGGKERDVCVDSVPRAEGRGINRERMTEKEKQKDTEVL